MSEKLPRKPSILEALIPTLFLIVLLTFCVIDLNELPEIAFLTPFLKGLARIPVLGSLLEVYIDPHLPLIGATAVASFVGWRLGFSWKILQSGMIDGIVMALTACIILMIVGMLIGTWILSGIVPSMIYYGLFILSPKIFLFAACVICALVALATGSSWSTAGTIGVALIGVGQGLGIPLPLVAGAIISGSYFGDKMSPLSDTTNLAPSVAGSELFAHIRHMVWTTGPSMLIALILYAGIGFFYAADEIAAENLHLLLDGISDQFSVHWLLLLPPILVAIVVGRRLPAIPALFGGAVLGGILAVAVQGATLADVMNSAHGGYVAESGIAAVDSLLSRGGLHEMLPTIALIICALAFGGVLEKTGMLTVLAEALLRMARSTGSLIATTIGTAIGVNVLVPDQYLSLIIPGRMYREAFQRTGLDPKNLSRCLEDAGTLTSPLIPWNTCGAFMWATLGVFPLAYLPFAFLNLINPLVSLLYGLTGWTIVKTDFAAEESYEEGKHSSALEKPAVE